MVTGTIAFGKCVMAWCPLQLFVRERLPRAKMCGNKAGAENSSKKKHFEEFKGCFEDPRGAGLGAIPHDLAEVLADIAIAGPATTTLRSVKASFKDDDFYNQTLFAFDIAGEFTSLFNRPEAIALVRLSTQPDTYWRRALRYCVDGCLQSVLDEFFHILEADCPTIWDLSVSYTHLTLPTKA